MITLNIDNKIYKPKESVKGKVSWSLEDVPKSIEARLFWFTKGRGTEDIQIVESMVLEPKQRGEAHVNLKLPEGPYTFSGKLISLIWAVECVANPSDECAREEIIVSPIGQEIILSEDLW